MALDSYAAMLVSGFVGTLSYPARESQALDELTDRFAHTEEYEKVSKAIKETTGVYRWKIIRMRRFRT